MKLPIPYEMAISKVHLKVIDQSAKLDRYGRVTPAWENDIDHCVVNMQTTYSGTNNNREIVANGLIIMYADWSSPMPRLTKGSVGSKLTYQGQEYTVTNISRYDQPGAEDLYSYELEVI